MRLWALKMRLWKQMRFWQQKKEALFLKMRLWALKQREKRGLDPKNEGLDPHNEAWSPKREGCTLNGGFVP